jgi:protein-disulfide isomerase
MSRTSLLLALVVAAIIGATATQWLRPTGPDEAQVRAIVSEVVAEAPARTDKAAIEQIVAEVLAKQPQNDLPHSVAAVDAAVINPMIEDYLVKNPRILERVSAALEVEVAAARMAETKAALDELHPRIYEAADQIVLGNPDGDVTLVEFFDYNCGYCRQALPDMAALLEEDKNLKVILKEFPILSEGSLEAAQVALQVADGDADYWIFHQSMFTSRGQVNGQTALEVAEAMGLSRVPLELGMKSPKVKQAITDSYEIAQALGISGTPSYILGDEVIPGAIGVEQLRDRIANLRACGSTVCPVVGNGG